MFNSRGKLRVVWKSQMWSAHEHMQAYTQMSGRKKTRKGLQKSTHRPFQTCSNQKYSFIMFHGRGRLRAVWKGQVWCVHEDMQAHAQTLTDRQHA